MPTPSVDVITGTVTNPPVELDESFEWTCSEAAQGTSITVIAQLMPDGNPWFSPSPTPAFTAKTGSVTVTAKGLGDWGWTATGVNVNAGARVHVVSTMPTRKAS